MLANAIRKMSMDAFFLLCSFGNSFQLPEAGLFYSRRGGRKEVNDWEDAPEGLQLGDIDFGVSAASQIELEPHPANITWMALNP